MDGAAAGLSLRMHDDELTVSDEFAARLVSRRFPELVGRPLRRVRSAATVNTIVRIGDDLVARFPLVAQTEEELRDEAAAMAELAAVSPVPSPRPYGVAAGHTGYPSAWSVQTWLPGRTADPVSHADSDELAAHVAELISSLRSVDTAGRRFDGRGRGGRLSDHDDWVALCIRRSAHLLDVSRAGALWDRLRAMSPPRHLAMSHRDLTPFNLLVVGERLSGVLDAGAFGAADPALDLVAAWHLFDAGPRESLRATVASDEEEWLRGAGWALQQALGLGWYYERSNPAMSTLGLSTVRRLLDDETLRRAD